MWFIYVYSLIGIGLVPYFHMKLFNNTGSVNTGYKGYFHSVNILFKEVLTFSLILLAVCYMVLIITILYLIFAPIGYVIGVIDD